MGQDTTSGWISRHPVMDLPWHVALNTILQRQNAKNTSLTEYMQMCYTSSVKAMRVKRGIRDDRAYYLLLLVLEML